MLNKTLGSDKDGYNEVIAYLSEIKKPIKRQVGRKKFIIYPNVFDPVFQDSQFLAKKLKFIIPKKSIVLDMGTGSGIQAIFAAEIASKVIAVDINPFAVKCARENIKLNKLDNKITVKKSNLFENIKKEKFDVIIWNPPFYNRKPINILEKACGDTDNKTLIKFIDSAKNFLNKNGFVLLVISDSLDYVIFLDVLRKNNCQLELIYSMFNKKNYHIVKIFYAKNK